MDNEVIRSLANANHASSEEMRKPLPQVFLPNMHPAPPDPTAEASRKISADVLKYIGDVYMGQAVQDE